MTMPSDWKPNKPKRKRTSKKSKITENDNTSDRSIESNYYHNNITSNKSDIKYIVIFSIIWLVIFTSVFLYFHMRNDWYGWFIYILLGIGVPIYVAMKN